MAKLLIISDNILVIQAVEARLKSKFLQVLNCSQKESIETIQKERPTHIFIGEYNEDEIPKDGGATWLEILEKNLIDREIIVRAGHGKYNTPNYLSMPLDMNELEQFLTEQSEEQFQST